MNDPERFFTEPVPLPTFEQMLAEWADRLDEWSASDASDVLYANVIFTPWEALRNELTKLLLTKPAVKQEFDRLITECRDAHAAYLSLTPIPLEAVDEEERDEVHEANQCREREAVAGLDHAIRELGRTALAIAGPRAAQGVQDDGPHPAVLEFQRLLAAGNDEAGAREAIGRKFGNVTPRTVRRWLNGR